MEITIETLLNPKTKPGDIFPRTSETEMKKLYKTLCLIYHPDVNKDPRATDAFTRLTSLFNIAIKNLDSDAWEKTNYIEFHLKNGKTVQITYQYHSTFEIGECYVTSTKVVYVFDFSKKKYYNNYNKKIKYANKDMEKIFKRLLPSGIKEYDTDDRHLIVIDKPMDVYPLKCLFENYFKGDIPERHLAWIISRLMNLACFFKYNDIVINGIDIDSLFVCPSQHAIYLYGGWWYSVPENTKMIGTTKVIYDIMPPKVKADKIASSVTDVESIKALGRKYLSTAAPEPFRQFLNSGTSSNTYSEMAKWDKALTDSYGKRRFIKLEVPKEDIYRKGDK